MPKKKRLTSNSSDEEIRAALRGINDKIKSYSEPALTKLGLSSDEVKDVQLQFSGRVQGLLTFLDKETISLKERKSGFELIPVTKKNVDAYRELLKKQEESYKKQKEIDNTYKRQETVAEKLDKLPALDDKLNEIQNQMKDKDRYATYSDETLVDIPRKGISHEERKNRKEINRRAAAAELAARANHEFSSSISDAIEKLYEDEVANKDLIDQLNNGKWSGELLERVNLRADGLDIEDNDPTHM